MKIDDTIRSMISSEDEEDYSLAINILRNSSNHKDIFDIVREALRDTDYIILDNLDKRYIKPYPGDVIRTICSPYKEYRVEGFQEGQMIVTRLTDCVYEMEFSKNYIDGEFLKLFSTRL